MNILLVDEEGAIHQALATALRASGHEVQTATDGAAALQALSRRSFDAMVCDVRLPELEGRSVLEQARAHAPSTRLVLTAAWTTPPPRPLVEAVREFELAYLERALEHTGGSRTRAAALLGISRKSLWAKLRRYRGGGAG